MMSDQQSFEAWTFLAARIDLNQCALQKFAFDGDRQALKNPSAAYVEIPIDATTI